MSRTERRFRVGLSFSGDERDYVSGVAKCLIDYFGKTKVFYDVNFRAELARLDLDSYLQRIYRDDSDLIVLFFSESYDQKKWCGLEWRAIKNIISDRSNHIVLVKPSTSRLPDGLFQTDGYLSAESLCHEELAKEIIQRYTQEFGKSDNLDATLPAPRLEKALNLFRTACYRLKRNSLALILVITTLPALIYAILHNESLIKPPISLSVAIIPIDRYEKMIRDDYANATKLKAYESSINELERKLNFSNDKYAILKQENDKLKEGKIISSITLSWNTSSRAIGYKIYYGMSTSKYTKMIDVGNTNNYRISFDEVGKYYIALKAYDANNNMSAFSKEVEYFVR